MKLKLGSTHYVGMKMLKRIRNFLYGQREINFLTLRETLILSISAIAAFHIAYTIPQCSFLIAVYLYCLFRLAWVRKTTLALYLGLIVGLSIIVPHFFFFWTIFGPKAIAFWFIGAIWWGIFFLISRMSLKKLNRIVAVLLIPFIWTGCEYFQSELYYFRCSWLIPGYTFSHNPQNLLLDYIGVYGVAFLIMFAIAIFLLLSAKKAFLPKIVLLLLLAAAVNIRATPPDASTQHKGPFVVAVQVEPAVAKEPSSIEETLSYLDLAIEKHPNADIVSMPEVTFLTPPPSEILSWCEQNQRYIIVGGLRNISPESDDTYNTAFVISPEGKIVFEQAKSTPVPFLDTSLPAKEQNLWNSPWGKIGICICWDMSFTRVTDKLVKLGAQALIVPSADLFEWGSHEQYLHARVTPVRAAEYSLPIFRVCNAISQLTSPTGQVLTSTSSPSPGKIVAGHLLLKKKGSIPIDRIIAPLSTILTAMIILLFLVQSVLNKYLTSARNPQDRAM